MAAVKQDLTIKTGRTFQFTVNVQTSGGVAQNLTGYSAKMQVRDSATSAVAMVDLSTASGGIALANVAGQVQVTIPAATTAGYTWTHGVYDISLTDPTGVVYDLAYGAVTVAAQVSR